MIDRAKVRFRSTGLQAIAQKAWGSEFEIMVNAGQREAPPPFEIDGDMAVMTIRGPLVHHAHWAWDSYESILCRAQAAFADSATKRVVMMIDSPGGDVDGCFETTRALRALSRASGKPLEVYADSMVASAAYALACAADRIVVSDTGCVGSIGIIEALCDTTDADEMAGVKYEFITSGDHKADGNPHVPISASAIANMQAQVDQMAGVFFELVSEMRGVSRETVKGLQARVLYGKAAVSAGLADELGTWPTLAHGTASQPGSVPESGTKGRAMKASYLRHMLRSLAESDGDDVSEEEKKHAKNFLKALEGDPEKKAEGKKAEEAAPGKDDPEAEGKKAVKAEAEAEGKKAEAEGKKAESHKADAKAVKAESEEDDMKGAKALSAVSSMAARLQAFEAKELARETAERRTKLMASRLDLAKEIVDWLDTQPIDVVEGAVKNLPKGPRRLAAMAEGSFAAGTRGKGNGEEQETDRPLNTLSESDFIARKMGASVEGLGIRHRGKTLELGTMTPSEARAFLKKQEAEAQATGKGQ